MDKTDSFHASATTSYKSITHPLVTTNYVADEIITLTKNRLGYKTLVEVGQKLWNEEVAILIHVTSNDEKKAWEIFVRHQDKGFSFTDCTRFAVMERLEINEAFTFDDHFSQYNDFIVLPSIQ